MGKAWRWIFAYVLVAAAALWWLSGRGPTIASGSALLLPVSGDYVEAPVNPLVARLFGQRQRSLLELLEQLAKAERDERIDVVVLRIGSVSAGWGKAAEIRSAIARLSARGRRTVAYLELEKLGGSREYFIATGADEIVMAPATRNPLLGLAAEFLFFGGLFEKIGIDVEYERIGEYKSAVESYAESKMSDANRSMTASLIDSIDAQFRAAIEEARNQTPEEVRAAIDEAPTSPERMVELGLVDRVAFLDEVLEGRKDDRLIEPGEYAQVDPASLGFAPRATFGIVFGSGPVVMGEGQLSPNGQLVLAADTVAGALRQAADSDVSAIIFRVDSPGGSPLASDVVWRAVARARELGKPVVASFSDVAASGGYYVACGADRIVSQPGTYTGSIGVYVLRPAIGGLLDRLGVGVETMTRGSHADLLLASQPLSPAARALLADDVRGVYEQFVGRVAEGRELAREEVDRVGRGRVWTGDQALERGLVDALGGIRTAILEAKKLVGLPEDADVDLLLFPPPKTLAEQVAEALGLAARQSMLPVPPTWSSLLAAARTLPPGVPLLVPPGLAEIR